MSSASGGPPAAKKSLSELSQGELVSKCQTLLGIAQKSKAAKDDAVSKVINGGTVEQQGNFIPGVKI